MGAVVKLAVLAVGLAVYFGASGCGDAPLIRGEAADVPPTAAGYPWPDQPPGESPAAQPSQPPAPAEAPLSQERVGLADGPAAARETGPSPIGTREAQQAEHWQRVAALLWELPSAEEHPAGYDRGDWPHWSDLDGDGCDTRREVLIAEAVARPAVGEGCKLSGGLWHSVYDGAAEEGSGRGFDVDHLVPLFEAHKSGGHLWSRAQRELFANDLGHPDALIAVSASSNRAKGASDPAEWMPSDIDVSCWYAAGWIEVKHRWSLSADPAERQALAAILTSCSQGGGASTLGEGDRLPHRAGRQAGGIRRN